MSTKTEGSTARPSPAAVPEPVATADQGLREAAATLQRSLQELHAEHDKALKEYTQEVEDALVHLNAGLDVASAQLNASRAQSREELADALHQADTSRKAWVDQLRVQAKLGSMEARDREEAATDALNEVGRRLEAVLNAVRHDTAKAWNDLWEDARSAISNLHRALYGT